MLNSELFLRPVIVAEMITSEKHIADGEIQEENDNDRKSDNDKANDNSNKGEDDNINEYDFNRSNKANCKYLIMKQYCLCHYK